jgi:hypothetical protein
MSKKEFSSSWNSHKAGRHMPNCVYCNQIEPTLNYVVKKTATTNRRLLRSTLDRETKEAFIAERNQAWRELVAKKLKRHRRFE